MATTNGSTFVPSINPNNHGPKVTVVGAVMLAAVALMVSIAAYNRWYANTLRRPDTPILVFGAVLYVVFYALSIVLVNHGFGKHAETLSDTRQWDLKRLFMGNLIIFFFAEGIVKISYNLLARRTARSKSYNKAIDAFSVVILLWALSNIIVTAVATTRLEAPNYAFFIASGIISILIVLGQLFAFLWIIWRTKAARESKISWSLSIGAFVPLCIAAIACRLAYTPRHPFIGDWTFHGVTNLILFLIDLGMVTITVMAPNLPTFFARTSTGGLFFQPGETIDASRKRSLPSSTNPNSDASRQASYAHARAWSEQPPMPPKRQSILRAFSRDNLTEQSADRASDGIMLETSVEIKHSDATDYADTPTSYISAIMEKELEKQNPVKGPTKG